MTVAICDRCGDVTVDRDLCRCVVHHDPVAIRRRHREAVARASSTDAWNARRTVRPSRAA